MTLPALIPVLPRRAWALLAGESIAAVGNGLTLPFVFVYVADVRGLDSDLAGFALALFAAVAFIGNPLSGWTSDRIGARRTLVTGLMIGAAGAVAMAAIRRPWEAFAGELGLSNIRLVAREPVPYVDLLGIDEEQNRAVVVLVTGDTVEWQLGRALGDQHGERVRDQERPDDQGGTRQSEQRGGDVAQLRLGGVRAGGGGVPARRDVDVGAEQFAEPVGPDPPRLYPVPERFGLGKLGEQLQPPATSVGIEPL